MVVYHNMMAQNAHRMLGVNQSTLGNSVEKLSSGLRVNRAADDAAGLSISEKMRGQIRGLTQASRNAQDAISVVQTAEGALNEAHDIIQRMRELAVQSANDSNVEIDRAAIQQEVTQLTDELDRIATTTQFNTMTLLDGTFSNKVFHIGANKDQNLSVDIDDLSAQGLGLRAGNKVASTMMTAAANKLTSAGKTLASYKKKEATMAEAISSIKTSSLKKKQGSVAAITASIGNLIAQGKMASAAHYESSLAQKKGSVSAIEMKINKLNNKIASVRNNGGTNCIHFQENLIDSLEAELQAKGGVLVNTQATANRAIKTIDDALTKVSFQRSELGAIQNRMRHTIKNLDNAAENTQASEARIRDTDMAKEMSEFTKKNILTQASQAMLAQANQLPQQVLQLLR